MHKCTNCKPCMQPYYVAVVENVINKLMSDREGNVDLIQPDDDGDYLLDNSPWRKSNDTPAPPCWVVVDSPRVEVLSLIARDLKDTRAVLKEVNHLNSMVTGGKAFLSEGKLYISAGLPGQAINEQSLFALITLVTNVSDDYGQMMATVHGGQYVSVSQQD